MAKKKPLEEDAQRTKKAKAGRPKRKSRTGMPLVTPFEAIEWIKRGYQEVGKKEKPFARMAEALGLPVARAKAAFGILANNYGLLKLEHGAWQITNLGERVAKNDKNAVLEVMQTVAILNELYETMKDRDVDRDIIEDYINRKRAGLNAKAITDRYLEIMDYISNSSPIKKEKSGETKGIKPQEAEMIRLMYALFPLGKEEDIQSQLDRLIELAEHYNFYSFVNFLQGARPFIKHKEDLQKVAKDAVGYFEDETGLILYPKHETKKVKEEKVKDENEDETD